jgi:uncharacterized membrane protein YjjP (DUF1212 family)
MAESVMEEFNRELRTTKLSRRRSMAKKQVWGNPPLWVFGVGLVLAAGLLMHGNDRWIMLVMGALILSADMGVLRLAEAKRSLFEVILSGAVAVTSIARLAESVGKSFTVNHVYLILALAGSILLLVEGFKRDQSGSESER